MHPIRFGANADRRPPDYSSNLCPSKTNATWLFKGVFGPLYKTTGRRPKTPPQKSYSKCLRWTLIRWVIWRSSSRDTQKTKSETILCKEFSGGVQSFWCLAALLRESLQPSRYPCYALLVPHSRLQKPFCRAKFAGMIFVLSYEFLMKNAPKFSSNVRAFVLWVRKNPAEFPPNFPQNFPAKSI